ncbi:replication protein A 70 kDa DNA-binding subunit B [Tanacetum coccineum]
MAKFKAGYINDLNPMKDNITWRVRILRAWMQPVYGKQEIKNLELIVFEEHNTRMQAQVRMKLVNQLKDRLKEGSDVTLEGYSLGEIQPKFRMLNKDLRLSFLSSTKVKPCPDFSGSFYGFDFRGYRSITDMQQEQDGQFDVIGHVIVCEDLDMYDKNGKSGKKKPLTLVDHEGNELQCTLWSAFAQQFNDFLNTCANHGKILKVGDGELGEENDGEVEIDVPEEILIDQSDDSVVLAPTNEVVDNINEHLLDKFPGEEMVYLSCDSVDKTERDAAIDKSIFSPEFINGLKFSGIPNHRLALKVGVPVMLLRNIDQPNCMCNGTRLQVLEEWTFTAQLINGHDYCY